MSSGERTPHASTAEDPSESVVRDAIDWLVRLKSSHATAEDRTAFEVWRRADPAHDAAWDRLQAMERDVGSLSSEQRTLVRSTLDSARRQQRRRQALKLIAIGGLVAGVGQRMLKSVSKHLIGRFFKDLRKQLESVDA